jgi:phosphoribosylformimino-5-aminoimidazole carboxamide ribotide isomerase
MLLIIPTIPIVHGLCASQISSLTSRDDCSSADIYSMSPADRARLLRKENSKTLNLEFFDSEPWSEESLSVIDEIRAAVDIPLKISMSELPEASSDLAKLFDHGIYRVFLPLTANLNSLFELTSEYSNSKVVGTVNLDFDLTLMSVLKDHGIGRLGVDISPVDTLESDCIDWDALKKLHDCAKSFGIRLTVLHGVRGYPDLRKLQEIGMGLDSLVLCRALNENRFPCQMIWRECEADAALEVSPTQNLWTNPLEGKDHI